LPKRYATFLNAVLLLSLISISPNSTAQVGNSRPGFFAASRPKIASSESQQAQHLPAQSSDSGYEGKRVQSINIPGVLTADREHLLQLIPQRIGEPLERAWIRDSIRTLYGTGRFSDIQAEVTPQGDGVSLSFVTTPNYFVGAVDVEGAPSRPNANQIVNASKLQLGELYNREKLNRALENVRQLMQENGFYRAQVTAESTANASDQQTDVLFHLDPGPQAHVGEVNVTGTSTLSSGQMQGLAHIRRGDRLTAVRVSDSLQRLRKHFQKENRALAQLSIAAQTYHSETNTVDFTFQIDPGPIVLITTQGYRISRGLLKKEIPVYEENAVDDDLLNEGRRNLLDYLQTRGHFDAAVDIRKESDEKTLRVIYQIDPGPLHKLAAIEISGNRDFLDTAKLLSYLQIQSAHPFLRHGRYSEALLKSDVGTLESLYRSNGFHKVQIQTTVDDNYRGSPNKLAVHIRIDEGVRTRVGEVHLVGNEKLKSEDLPELSTQAGQPYSEQDLSSDRERVLNYYFDHGFPNATLEIGTKTSTSQPDREDVTFSLQEGQRFTVNQVMVAGTEHTRDYVVQRELQVQSADPLSQQDLLSTQTRLYDLGIFSQVDTAVQNPDGADPKKNILVQVMEAKRYTFTYDVGLEFQTGQPSGTTAPQGTTGVSPRVGLDVTRLNVFGRNETLTFSSHVGRLQQRGLISFAVPKLFDSDKFKLIYTIFYDNSLDVATFTSQRLEGKIDLRQQFGKSGREPGTRPGPDSMTYRFDFRTVKASNFAEGFSPGEIALLSLPARVGGPGFTFIHDKRDNPLESTKGDYFTLDAFAALSTFGTRSETPQTTPPTNTSLPTNFGRALAEYSTYYAFGNKGKPGRQFVFARSTSIGIEQPFRNTRVLPPGSCPLNSADEPTCVDIATIPLPEQFFAGGGNSHRGFGLNQAGPRDPNSGFPVGGTAQFVNNLELRFPTTSLPYLGEGFGFAIFHDMGNVFTAPHDMLKGLLRWHQPSTRQCLSTGTTTSQDCTAFNNTGYDYTSHALGVGVRYKTPIGPLRFDFGYNLNPTSYFQTIQIKDPITGITTDVLQTQRLRHFSIFFSIGQPF
jgi:outer membrane protein insertion porin family